MSALATLSMELGTCPLTGYDNDTCIDGGIHIVESLCKVLLALSTCFIVSSVFAGAPTVRDQYSYNNSNCQQGHICYVNQCHNYNHQLGWVWVCNGGNNTYYINAVRAPDMMTWYRFTPSCSNNSYNMGSAGTLEEASNSGISYCHNALFSSTLPAAQVDVK